MRGLLNVPLRPLARLRGPAHRAGAGSREPQSQGEPENSVLFGSTTWIAQPTSTTDAPELAITQGWTAALVVHVDRTDRRVTVHGELDLASVPVLADAVAPFLTTDPGDCAVDISGVTFIDAAGIGCLVGFTNEAASKGSTMSIVGASLRLRRLFEILELGGLLHPS